MLLLPAPYLHHWPERIWFAQYGPVGYGHSAKKLLIPERFQPG
jgi:hypothetical protein